MRPRIQSWLYELFPEEDADPWLFNYGVLLYIEADDSYSLVLSPPCTGALVTGWTKEAASTLAVEITESWRRRLDFIRMNRTPSPKEIEEIGAGQAQVAILRYEQDVLNTYEDLKHIEGTFEEFNRKFNSNDLPTQV